MTRGRTDLSGTPENPMPVTFDSFAPTPQATPTYVTNEQLMEMARRVADLEERLGGHTGMISGATINNPHPRQMRFYREIHGPSRQSIDSTHSVTFIVNYDDLATQLYEAKLTFRLSAVRANLSTAASGGAQTSGSGGSQTPTSSSGGSQTPTSGSSSASSSSQDDLAGVSVYTTGGWPAGGNTSAVAPGTSDAGGTGATGAGSSHNHASSATDSTTSAEPDTGHTHTVTSATGYESGHTHTGPSHTHGYTTTHVHNFSPSISAILSAYGHVHPIAHTHTVTVAAHTHTVTVAAHDHSVAAHTHSLTFTTIQEGSAPSTPGVTVTINGTDRTTALGGPWNSSQTDLSVTQYLRNTAGEPLRQENTFVFTSTELLDIEVVLKSFCGSSTPWTVGTISV